MCIISFSLPSDHITNILCSRVFWLKVNGIVWSVYNLIRQTIFIRDFLVYRVRVFSKKILWIILGVLLMC